MVKMTTIRLILALTTMFTRPICQVDVTNTFLHGDLQETIYME